MTDKENLCQLRINAESFDWQIGTWARRQFYTIYKFDDNKLHMALIDSAQKQTSGRTNHEKYVRIVIIFVVVLASLFVIFSVACCVRKYYQRQAAAKEVTFATVDEQMALKNNLNATQEETIDQEDAK